jgi:hypothetical protein
VKLRVLPVWDGANSMKRGDAKIFISTIKDFFLNRWSRLSKSLTARFADYFQVIQKPAF